VTPYRHTQVGTLNLLLLGSPALACLLVFSLSNNMGAWSILVLGLVLLFVGLAFCFSSLTIEVDAERVGLSFGPGWIRKSWPIENCTAARQIRTRLIDGWGIKLTSQGWLYSISMPHAVLVRFTDGKAVQLGTDEPEALLATLLEAGLDLEDAD
jgi:hypothetical protein